MSKYEILPDDELISVQKVELGLLSSFVNICDQLNLRYFLAYGTLIGAVRHKGFIPWDDDIDIWMPRRDYDLFISKAPKLLPEYYFLQTPETDKEYVAGFMKIRDSRTTFIESNYKNKNMNHGVYIDIFPLEYCPNNIVKYSFLRLYRSINLLRTRKEMHIVENATKHNIVSSRLLTLISNLVSLFTPDIDAFARKRERYLRRLNEIESSYYCNFYSYSNTLKFPTAWFGEGKKCAFENLTVIIPESYDTLLRYIYSNYMELPPKEKQVTKHYTEKIDMKKSYKQYMNT